MILNSISTLLRHPPLCHLPSVPKDYTKMQTITMLGAFVLAIASLVSMTAAIMPETESSMVRIFQVESLA